MAGDLGRAACLTSSPERMIRQLLGTHHDAEQFVHDLQILACYPGALETLREAAYRVVHEDSRRP